LQIEELDRDHDLVVRERVVDRALGDAGNRRELVVGLAVLVEVEAVGGRADLELVDHLRVVTRVGLDGYAGALRSLLEQVSKPSAAAERERAETKTSRVSSSSSRALEHGEPKVNRIPTSGQHH
jgi:hypothetical protein